MKIYRKLSLAILLIVALAAGFAGGFYYKNSVLAPSPVNVPVVNKDVGQPKGLDFSLFWNVWDSIHSNYVDKGNLNTQDLIYGAVDGMVKAVGDPYTVFFEPKESQAFAEQINGSFSGIGIEIGLRNNVLTVISPIKNTPAAKAGLLAGDKILKIDDKTTDGMTVDEAANLIRGPGGTKVSLTILRNGSARIR